MKNIHIILTDKPSRLWTNNLRRRLELDEFPEQHPTNIAKHIYITSDEEIKEGDWIFNEEREPSVLQCIGKGSLRGWKKIILTTDQDLIKDGVQAIDDGFLEWFVKNSSCEYVEVKPLLSNNGRALFGYKIIIPKEEPKQELCATCGKTLREQMKGCTEITCYRQFLSKQETLEEVAERLAPNSSWRLGFIEGAKWQAERSYSKEEIIYFLQQYRFDLSSGKTPYIGDTTKDWFKQFKKK